MSELDALEASGKKLTGKREYRRFQRVWLCIKDGKTQQQVAELLNLYVRPDRKHNERYRNEGLSGFAPCVPGP